MAGRGESGTGMPSGSLNGWETDRRRRRWPRWSARSAAVTGLFAVAILAAALGVGRTVIAPAGPGEATGTAGTARALASDTQDATPDPTAPGSDAGSGYGAGSGSGDGSGSGYGSGTGVVPGG